jgi:hypothetical protein
MMRLDFQPQFTRMGNIRQDAFPTALRSFAGAVQGWPFLHWVTEKQRRRRFRQALARTYGSYSTRYPQWTSALFDEHFLTGRAYPFLNAYGQGDADRDPAALAKLWAEQMWFSPEKRQDRALVMTPAAACFLNLLDAELGKQRSA